MTLSSHVCIPEPVRRVVGSLVLAARENSICSGGGGSWHGPILLHKESSPAIYSCCVKTQCYKCLISEVVSTESSQCLGSS